MLSKRQTGPIERSPFKLTPEFLEVKHWLASLGLFSTAPIQVMGTTSV